MPQPYVLDACALIAYFDDEPGAARIQRLLREAGSHVCELHLHQLNLLEVYYGFYRHHGERADEVLRVVEHAPIQLHTGIDNDLLRVAGRLKAKYRRVSLADCVLIALARSLDAQIVSADHHELERVAAAEQFEMFWFR